MFVSHLISATLHISFYLYSQHNEAAGVIATLFTPALSYLTLLGFVYFTISHFILKEIRFDLIGNPMDRFLPTNECKSRRIIVLLQSYTMILHMTFVTFLDKWFDYSILSFSVVLAIVILQLFLICINLRIFNKYPASANVPFYVSAHLMIVKLLVDQIVQYYKMYKSEQTFSLQPMCFSNRLVVISLCLFMVCILNESVAYASDEAELELAVTEGGSAGRYARTGITFAGGAGFYEGVSAGREYFEDQGGLSEQGEELNTKVEECIAAKDLLNNIDYKLRSEAMLIRKVENYLKMVEENKNSVELEDLREYKNRIVKYTSSLKASYEQYDAEKSQFTNQLYRKLFGVNNCCCSTRAVKES